VPDDLPTSLNTHDLLFWVTELQAGRPDAAEPTFRRIVARVETLARAMFKKFPRVGRFVDVEDVIQNSLLRLLAAFREVRPASTRDFYALVNTLIRRELLDLAKHYYSTRGLGTNLAEASVGEGETDVIPVAPHDPDDFELYTAFHEAIERLPAEEREVIGLTFYHGWTQAEVADLFQVSVRTVQRWNQSAFESIRRFAPKD
jgi:RNA polymerase sigma-70 factor (ECF subfamily)